MRWPEREYKPLRGLPSPGGLPMRQAAGDDPLHPISNRGLGTGPQFQLKSCPPGEGKSRRDFWALSQAGGLTFYKRMRHGSEFHTQGSGCGAGRGADQFTGLGRLAGAGQYGADDRDAAAGGGSWRGASVEPLSQALAALNGTVSICVEAGCFLLGKQPFVLEGSVMAAPPLLSYEDLRRFCPSGRRSILRELARYSALLADYGLRDNERRLCHFLAQAAHETAGFRTLREYGSRRYFQARYGHRRDLGNLSRADGSRFRGRGIFQLTGRANYRKYGRLLGLDLLKYPQQAEKVEIALRIAGEYWRMKSLNRLADRNDLRGITRRINGGLNGLAQRKRYLRRAMSIWGPAAMSSAFETILRKGDRGPRVMRLQNNLHLLGFKLRVDGWFGRHTRKALMLFQRRNGILADGLYGPESRQMMVKRLAERQTLPSLPPKEKKMNQWKSYLESRTIWANLIGFAALALDVLGFNGLNSAEQSQLVDQLLTLIQAGGFIAGVIFRAIARKRLVSPLYSG